MPRKDELDPYQQRDQFAKAHETVTHYINTGSFLSAYVIAFSILEDRITAMYSSAWLHVTGETLELEKCAGTPFGKKLSYLATQEVISLDDKDAWIELAYERNRKIHAAMWRLDEFQESDVRRLLAIVAKANNARQRQKRQLVKLGKIPDTKRKPIVVPPDDNSTQIA